MAIAARTAMSATVIINSIRVKPVGRCMGTPFFCGSMIGNSGSPPQTFPTSGRNRRTYGTSAGILAELVHVPGARLTGVVNGLQAELDRVQVLVYNGFREKTAQPKSRKYRPAAASARHHADAPAHGNRPCAVHAARAPLGGSDPEVGQLALR